MTEEIINFNKEMRNNSMFFHCDKLIWEDGKLKAEFGEKFMELEEVKEITFEIAGKEHKYRRVENATG